jgi:anti-anti-sigma regulatory factor
METQFKVTPGRGAGCDLFTLHGNIDAQAETMLKELPTRVSNPVVRFDFGPAGRINSMGIALLLRCFKHIREQKKAEIELVALNPMNSILFKMTGVFLLAKPVEQ